MRVDIHVTLEVLSRSDNARIVIMDTIEKTGGFLLEAVTVRSTTIEDEE